MKVWTFFIQGGEPFEMSLPGNPKLDHKGKTSVWKLCGSQKLKEAAEDLILTQSGASVQVHTEGETAEQKVIREGRHMAISEAADDFDYTTLDEGIRHTVKTLRQAGFNTCDSGDGSKAATMECALAFPNVFISVKPVANLIPETIRLQEFLEGHGVEFAPLGMDTTTPYIQGSYEPMNDSAVISLFYAIIPEQ